MQRMDYHFEGSQTDTESMFQVYSEGDDISYCCQYEAPSLFGWPEFTMFSEDGEPRPVKKLIVQPVGKVGCTVQKIFPLDLPPSLKEGYSWSLRTPLTYRWGPTIKKA